MTELAEDEFRRLAHLAVELAADHIYGMRERPVFVPMSDAERGALMNAELPARGVAGEDILALVRERVVPYPMGNGHPRFFAWANPPPSPIGVIADLLAAAINPSCAGGDHAAIYVERCAVRWLMELTGFPVAGSMGILVSGGSMGSLTCLAAARQRALASAGSDVRSAGFAGAPRLVLYVSDQGHSCLRKAAELLGLGAANVRVVATDAGYRMELGALRAAIAADRAQGLAPFCVGASAGTVNSGAIDPLSEIADLCAEQGLWFHVDGAIGAVAAVDPTLPGLAALSRADSLALDPHKWLGVPAECGAALLRDGQLLRDTFSFVPEYLRTEPGKGFGGLPWYSEYGFQQTRGFRGLKLWTTLLHLGRDGVRARIERHRELARVLAERITAEPALQLLTPPELSIVCFRYLGTLDRDAAHLRRFNKALAERLQSDGTVFLTGTELKDTYALRACVMHYGTELSDVTALIDTVLETAARLNEPPR